MSDETEIENLSRDISLLSKFVHGDETTAVILGDVPTPSLRALVADIKTGAASLTEKLLQYESRLARLESALTGLDEQETEIDGVRVVIRPIGVAVALPKFTAQVPEPPQSETDNTL